MSASIHHEVILAGSGGQGLILAGILLAEAATAEGRNVVQTQSYGIASRGGLSLAEVIVADDEIVFQQVVRPDCVLALTEESAKKFEAWAARGVPLLYDSTLAAARSGAHCIGIEFTRIAGDLGNADSANVLALAAVSEFLGVVRRESLEALLRKRFRGPALELNLKLLDEGSRIGAECRDREGVA